MHPLYRPAPHPVGGRQRNLITVERRDNSLMASLWSENAAGLALSIVATTSTA